MSSREVAVWLSLILASVVPVAETTAAERVLVPVFFGERNPNGFGLSAGVNGWITAAFVANTSAEPVTGDGISFSVDCVIPEGCPMSSVPAGKVGEIFAPVSEAGLVLHVPTSDHVAVAASAFRWPSTSPSIGIGSQLPIAREADFVSRPLRFLFVPISNGGFAPTLRVHLRVYSLVDAPVRVRVEMQSFRTVAGPIGEVHEVDLRGVASPAPPRFAFVDLVAQFPWAAAHTTWENVTVVPLPSADGSVPKIWAFVSVTAPSNEIRIIPPG